MVSVDNGLRVSFAFCLWHFAVCMILETCFSHQVDRSWWRHQIETLSALLAICAGNSPVPGEFPAQRPDTRSSDVLFDLRLNQRLSKQSWGWWFETLSHPLWCHCNVCSQWRAQYPHCTQSISWLMMTKYQEESGHQNPDSMVHGANMGPIWGRQDRGEPHVGPRNFALWASMALTYMSPNTPASTPEELTLLNHQCDGIIWFHHELIMQHTHKT